MKSIDVVEEVLQPIRDVFEDIVALKQGTGSLAQFSAWYDWALDYLMENLSISKGKSQEYLYKLTGINGIPSKNN